MRRLPHGLCAASVLEGILERDHAPCRGGSACAKFRGRPVPDVIRITPQILPGEAHRIEAKHVEVSSSCLPCTCRGDIASRQVGAMTLASRSLRASVHAAQASRIGVFAQMTHCANTHAQDVRLYANAIDPSSAACSIPQRCCTRVSVDLPALRPAEDCARTMWVKFSPPSIAGSDSVEERAGFVD